jgi:catechol 2,3-dioxygenase-like lactoylglutathione lyase family enzyme
MRLTHIRLLVTDYDVCFRFYRDVMGLEVTWGAEGEGYADFKAAEGIALALFGRKDQAEAVGTTNLPEDAEAQDRVALIFDVEDVDTRVADLKARGASFVTDPQDRPDWGIRTAHLRDPDGNLIELVSSIPRGEWSTELQEEANKYD